MRKKVDTYTFFALGYIFASVLYILLRYDNAIILIIRMWLGKFAVVLPLSMLIAGTLLSKQKIKKKLPIAIIVFLLSLGITHSKIADYITIASFKLNNQKAITTLEDYMIAHKGEIIYDDFGSPILPDSISDYVSKKLKDKVLLSEDYCFFIVIGIIDNSIGYAYSFQEKPVKMKLSGFTFAYTEPITKRWIYYETH